MQALQDFSDVRARLELAVQQARRQIAEHYVDPARKDYIVDAFVYPHDRDLQHFVSVGSPQVLGDGKGYTTLLNDLNDVTCDPKWLPQPRHKQISPDLWRPHCPDPPVLGRDAPMRQMGARVLAERLDAAAIGDLFKRQIPAPEISYAAVREVGNSPRLPLMNMKENSR